MAQTDTEIRKIWIHTSGSKSRYALHTAGAVVGITLLVLLLAVGGTVLVLRQGLPAAAALTGLCLAVTALAVWLAVRAGRRSLGDATVFFLTGADKLYLLDTARLQSGRGSLAARAADAFRLQDFLRRLAADPVLPAAVLEVCRVEQIRENRNCYAAVCQLRRGSGQAFRRTVLVVKGMQDEDLLLRQLERRQGWENTLELRENRNPIFILLSVLACGTLAALCVLSHPAVGRLPESCYFPCLAGAFAALFCVVWSLVRRGRGE